jgi:8-amino-7-oxononanoate synthase
MKNSPIFERIDRALARRKETRQFRSIPGFLRSDQIIDLSTNSYLSLHKNPMVIHDTGILTKDILSGNLASRLVSEQSTLFSELEQEIASWKKTEAALIFNSGYAANLGILQAICTKDTEVFCDRLNHASIYDGIALSGARINRYLHNDMSDLQTRLEASTVKEKLIVTDTVFSMDGDRAFLGDICELAERYGCMVMVDEAHGTGIFGTDGSGLTEESGVGESVDIRMGTLSKTIAGLGGYCAVSTVLRDYFINFSRSLIYSTALPHSILAHNISAIRYIRRNRGIGNILLAKADSFRAALHRAGFSTLNSTTQIVPCIMETEEQAMAVSILLKQRGIMVPAIRPPTVPKGTSRLRFSVFLDLTEDQEHYIIDQLIHWKFNHE